MAHERDLKTVAHDMDDATYKILAGVECEHKEFEDDFEEMAVEMSEAYEIPLKIAKCICKALHALGVAITPETIEKFMEAFMPEFLEAQKESSEPSEEHRHVHDEITISPSGHTCTKEAETQPTISR